MKILSQGFVDEHDIRRKGFRDCYKWHCGLWEVCANNGKAGASEEAAFLFRVDRQGKRCRVLVLCDHEPQESEWIKWQSTRVDPDFLEANQYRFQLKANPTVKRAKVDRGGEPTKNGRRSGIYKHDELMSWMKRKSKQSGFEIVGQMDYAGPVDEFFVKKGRRGKLTAVDFRGVLQVRDRELFRSAFVRGIGSAKGFGFGMLMLQPLSQ